MIMKNYTLFLKLKWLLYFVIFIICPLRYKAFISDGFFIHNTGIRAYGELQSIFNDSIIIFYLLFLVYLSLIIKIYKIFRYILRTFAALIFIVYITDIYILYNFTTHLTIADVLKYGDYAGKFLYQIHGLTGIMLIIMSALLVALVIVDFDNLTIKNKKDHSLFIVIMLIFLSAYQFRDQTGYVHSWVYKNFIDYNYSLRSQSAEYSKAFINKIRDPNEGIHCFEKNAKKKNIIILMIESLSSYHSHFFSGIKNWTPNLDSIAKTNLSYINFYANGFNSEDGYIAVLTGLLPISSPLDYSKWGGVSFRGFMDIPNSLPNIVKSYGYKSYFLTSGTLMFNEGHWAQNVGFDYVEGSNHPYYNRWPRFHFNSVPDAALYYRAIAILSQNGKQPFLMFISTLSSHHPFINPENGRHSEEEVIRYVDKEIGRFYEGLRRIGFFDSGILVITGDHHAMVPSKEAEIKKFGTARALARVPLIISYGDTVMHIEKSAFQHTDIYNSLKNLLSEEKCVSNWLGDLLNIPRIPPIYIAHKRSDDRSLISVFYGSEDVLLKLNGDHTKVIQPNIINKNIANTIINKINYERILRGKSR